MVPCSRVRRLRCTSTSCDRMRPNAYPFDGQSNQAWSCVRTLSVGREPRWVPSGNLTSSAAPEERRNIEVVVLVGKDRLGQAGANRADADRTLLALGRTVAVALLDRQAPGAAAGRLLGWRLRPLGRTERGSRQARAEAALALPLGHVEASGDDRDPDLVL